MPVLLNCLADKSGPVLLFSDMADDAVCLPSISFDLLDSGVDMFLVSAGDDHPDSLLSQSYGNAFSDAC